ncbi:MAG: SAM-dependent chlorinase/fluorinase [Bacteroidia bacterium]|nr:SAM-dependent chlorinase/fluorinase [Bacteroidia bacterium]
MNQKPPIVLLTDFGQRDGYVGIMKGVIHGINPEASIIDLAHDLPPQSIEAARFILWNSYKYFPNESIFVCVVDPGVGSERKIHIYQTQKHVFIVPDNGVLDYVLAEQGIRYAFELENPRIRLSEVSNTFHGRDLFAPAAAQLSKGFVITQVGPTLTSYKIPISPFIHYENQTQAKIIHVDRYGNLITNIKANQSTGLIFIANGNMIQAASSYSQVDEGSLLAIGGSHGLWEIAKRNGNASLELGLDFGNEIQIQQIK